MKDLNRLVSENKINVSYENGCCIATDCITFQKVYIKNISKVIIGLRTNSVPEDFLYIDKCLIMAKMILSYLMSKDLLMVKPMKRQQTFKKCYPRF